MAEVSVVVTVYNVERYISRCIESIQKQTFSNIEIIVVNDGTPDNSMKIVRRIAEDDARIVIVDNSENKGLAMARRDGYLNSNTDFVVFVDSDDALPKDAIELLYHTQSLYDADIVKGSLLVRNNQGKEWLFHNNKFNSYSNKEDVFSLLLNGEMTHNLAGCLFKKNILTNPSIITLNKMTNSEDAFLFYQLINYLKNSIVTIPNVVYYYYINNNSSTHQKLSDDAIRKMIKVQKYKIDISVHYPNITHVFKHAVTRYLFFLSMMSGNNRINIIAKEEGMNLFTTITYRIHYLNLRDYVDIVKYYISSRINRIFIK